MTSLELCEPREDDSHRESRINNQERRLSLPCYRARHVHIDSCEEMHINDERVDTGAIEIRVAEGAVKMLV